VCYADEEDMRTGLAVRLCILATGAVLAGAGLRAAGLGAAGSIADPWNPPPTAPTAAGATLPHDADGQRATVTSVVDGDTIRVRVLEAGDLPEDRTEQVRLPALDAPETVHPSQPVGCGGPEASAFVTDLLEGETVRLQRDRKDRDRYGRAIRYVRLEDGRLADELIVAAGHARAKLYDADDRYYPEMVAAEEAARDAGRGLWGHCHSGASLPDVPVEGALDRPSPAPGKPATGSGICDPAYPEVCITPGQPDIDCSGVPARRFQVFPPDPHHLDGDDDGIGCEG